MFGLLPIEGSWFLRFEKLLEESFRKSPRPSLPLKRGIFRKPTLNGLYTPFGSPVPGGQKPSLPLKRGIFRKPTRPPLPLREAPPLTPTLSPSGEREETALLGAWNRYALRMADHQRSRQIVRDGTALLQLASGLRHLVRAGTARGALKGKRVKKVKR